MTCYCGKPLLKSSFFPMVHPDDPTGTIQKICYICREAFTTLSMEELSEYLEKNYDFNEWIPKKFKRLENIK